MISRRTLLSVPLLGAAQSRFRVAVVGTEHGHVRGFLNAAAKRPDVEIVGPLEFERRGEVKRGQVEAVACFTSTDRHLEVARHCAAQKLPMMMEKPLAVSNEAAREMARLSREAGVPFFVNYETTWYASHGAQRKFFAAGGAGKIRKMVAMHGHAGPKEIGVGPEFFAWLNDPRRNGAGALFDFGCYGANLMTWLMGNERPEKVVAVTRRHKPAIYTQVDDEATIVVDYASGAQGIIQASWNWPFSRKDFEVYGAKAYAHAYGGNQVRQRQEGEKAESVLTPAALAPDEADAISYLKAVVRDGKQPGGLSGLENNLIATEILVAARASAAKAR